MLKPGNMRIIPVPKAQGIRHLDIIVRINILILLSITLIFQTTTSASSLTPENCRCPSGYLPTITCGNTHCAAEAAKTDPCPESATYDDSLALCAADPDNYGRCPKGMTRPLYKQKCVSKKTDEYTCPSGGKLDKKRGYCTAPCMTNNR